jgi:mRNA interferase MazF
VEGHEQRGVRPAIVIQSDDASWLSTTIVAPTSTAAQPASFRPEVSIRGRRTRVLLDQMRVVDNGRLGRSSGLVASAELRSIDRALRLLLGLF